MTVHSYQIQWEGINIEINHTPQKWGVIEYLEIKSANREALPITETGYISHFLSEDHLNEYRGPVSYVTSWLEHEASLQEWKDYLDSLRQYSLF